jgi:hypothetical protein
MRYSSFKALKSVIVIHGHSKVNGTFHTRGSVKFVPADPSAPDREVFLEPTTVAHTALDMVKIDRYTPKLIARDGRGRLADAVGKGRQYYRRQEEREATAIIESDEDAAIRYNFIPLAAF